MNKARKIVTMVTATALLGVVAAISTNPATYAAVSLGGYSGYTAETFAADTLAQDAAHSSLLASATTASVAGDFAEANGGEGGSGSNHCSVETYKPRGYFDESTYTVHVQVTAEVWCNFTSPQITMKVILQGNNGAQSLNHPSSDVTCSGSATCTATSYYSRGTYCGESFKFEHYGRPYGSYRLKNGTWRTLVGDGVAGPSATGGAYRFC